LIFLWFDNSHLDHISYDLHWFQSSASTRHKVSHCFSIMLNGAQFVPLIPKDFYNTSIIPDLFSFSSPYPDEVSWFICKVKISTANSFLKRKKDLKKLWNSIRRSHFTVTELAIRTSLPVDLFFLIPSFSLVPYQ
jgi:hypothetical protein